MTGIELRLSVRGVLEPWIIVEWMSHSSLLQGLFWYFSSFFSDFISFFQKLLVFSSCRDLLHVFWWYWRVSPQPGCFGTFVYSKMQLVCFSFSWYHLTLRDFVQFFWFFNRILMFFRCKDNFGYLRLMLVCLTMGGNLERFFRTRYHIFSRVAIRVTSHVTLLKKTGSFLPFPTHYHY